VLRPTMCSCNNLVCQERRRPFNPNSLPGLVETGEAHRIELQIQSFDGTMSFGLWVNIEVGNKVDGRSQSTLHVDTRTVVRHGSIGPYVLQAWF
jgi:hypothetical protein